MPPDHKQAAEQTCAFHTRHGAPHHLPHRQPQRPIQTHRHNRITSKASKTPNRTGCFIFVHTGQLLVRETQTPLPTPTTSRPNTTRASATGLHWRLTPANLGYQISISALPHKESNTDRYFTNDSSSAVRPSPAVRCANNRPACWLFAATAQPTPTAPATGALLPLRQQIPLSLETASTLFQDHARPVPHAKRDTQPVAAHPPPATASTRCRPEPKAIQITRGTDVVGGRVESRHFQSLTPP